MFETVNRSCKKTVGELYTPAMSYKILNMLTWRNGRRVAKKSHVHDDERPSSNLGVSNYYMGNI